MPLSKRPRKSVCGLTRDTVTTASASKAFLSHHTGSPQLLVPMLHGGHVGLHRHAQRLLADAVFAQQVALTGRRGAAVTAHRGHDERLSAEVAQTIEGGADDRGHVGDTAAADADRHAAAATDAAGHTRFAPQPPYLDGDIGNRGLRGRLAKRGQMWNVHGRKSPQRRTVLGCDDLTILATSPIRANPQATSELLRVDPEAAIP